MEYYYLLSISCSISLFILNSKVASGVTSILQIGVAKIKPILCSFHTIFSSPCRSPNWEQQVVCEMGGDSLFPVLNMLGSEQKLAELCYIYLL